MTDISVAPAALAGEILLLSTVTGNDDAIDAALEKSNALIESLIASPDAPVYDKLRIAEAVLVELGTDTDGAEGFPLRLIRSALSDLARV